MTDMKKTIDTNTVTSISGGEFDDVDVGLTTVMSPSGKQIVIKANDVDMAMEFVKDHEHLEWTQNMKRKF